MIIFPPFFSEIFLFLFLFIHLSQVPPKWREHIGELSPVVQCLVFNMQ